MRVFIVLLSLLLAEPVFATPAAYIDYGRNLLERADKTESISHRRQGGGGRYYRGDSYRGGRWREGRRSWQRGESNWYGEPRSRRDRGRYNRRSYGGEPYRSREYGRERSRSGKVGGRLYYNNGVYSYD